MTRPVIAALTVLSMSGTLVGVSAAVEAPPAGSSPVCVEVSSRCPDWASDYDYPGGRKYVGQQKLRSMAVSPDGSRVFVTGSIVDDDTRVDYGTVAYDTATGAMLWAARHDGPTHWDDRAYGLAVSPDGTRVFVTGHETVQRESASIGSFATVAYDAATGQDVWVARYDAPAGGDDRAIAVAVAPDGSRLYVTGSSQAASRAREFATVAYDPATGEQIWATRYAAPGGVDASPTALAVSDDGSRVFVTGQEVVATDPVAYGYATVAYATGEDDGGEELWVARHRSPGDGATRPSAIAVDGAGARVVVTGASVGASSGLDYGTLAYDAATGQELWQARYDGGQLGDVATALSIDPSGDRVYVTGHSTIMPPDPVEYTITLWRTDNVTVAYDAASGAELWESRFASTAGHVNERGTAIGVSADGARVFVGGFTHPVVGGYGDDPTSPNMFGGCSSSSSGHYGSVAGNNSMGSFLTVAYEAATGSEDWHATFNSATYNQWPGLESGGIAALAVGPDDRTVYVAGTFAYLYADSCDGPEQIQNYTDYWTVAYPV